MTSACPQRRAGRAALLVAVAWGLAALSTSRAASAAAGQWQAGGRLGAAWLAEASLGPSSELYLRRGLTDSLELDVQVIGSLHPFQGGSKTGAAASAMSTGVSSPATAW